MLLAAVGMVCLTGVSASASYASDVLPGLLVVGLGMGFTMATAMGSATLGVKKDDAGVASAMVNTGQQIGGAVGTALLSTVAASATASFMTGKTVTPEIHAQAAVHGYTTAFWMSAAIFAIGALVCGLLLRPGVQAPGTAPEPAMA